MRAAIAKIILCGSACQSADSDLHNMIKQQQAQIFELEVELEYAGHCEAALQACEAYSHSCDMLRMQEVQQWKEIAEACVSKKLEVKVR